MYLHVNVWNTCFDLSKWFKVLNKKLRLPKNANNELELKELCKDLQDNILGIIIGNDDVFKANYVASFGDLIDSVNVTDWIEIKNSININVIYFKIIKFRKILFSINLFFIA